MNSRRKDNNGIALIITLIFITLISIIVLEFSTYTRVNLSIAGNERDALSAYFNAKSGVNIAVAVLYRDMKTNNYDTLQEEWAKKYISIPLDKGTVSVEIIDEGRKLNINTLVKKSGIVDSRVKSSFERLLRLLNLDTSLVDVIIDWIDRDSKSESRGAEDSYYLSLNRPYRAKNNYLDTITELRLVKGISSQVLNRLKNYVTVNSDGLVNINTADSYILQSLSPKMTPVLADKIIEHRRTSPFKKKLDLGSIPEFREIYTEIAGFISERSNAFSITSTGDVNGTKQIIRAIVERRAGNIEVTYWRVE